MSDHFTEIASCASQAVNDHSFFELVVSKLQDGSRKNRQTAAMILGEISKEHPEKLSESLPVLIEALDVPEAQTRWCILEVLAALVALDPSSCEAAIDGAETSLFDERHAYVREKALCFLCKLGAVSPEMSRSIWPTLDEAIQCYHGNPEFMSMLGSILEFSQGDLDPLVKAELSKRLEFDANNTKGALGKRAQQIISTLK